MQRNRPRALLAQASLSRTPPRRLNATAGSLPGLQLAGAAPIAAAGIALSDLTTNVVFMSALYAWATAQVLKASLQPSARTLYSPPPLSHPRTPLLPFLPALAPAGSPREEEKQRKTPAPLLCVQRQPPPSLTAPRPPPCAPPQVFTKYARTRSWDWRVLVRPRASAAFPRPGTAPAPLAATQPPHAPPHDIRRSTAGACRRRTPPSSSASPPPSPSRCAKHALFTTLQSFHFFPPHALPLTPPLHPIAPPPRPPAARPQQHPLPALPRLLPRRHVRCRRRPPPRREAGGGAPFPLLPPPPSPSHTPSAPHLHTPQHSLLTHPNPTRNRRC